MVLQVKPKLYTGKTCVEETGEELRAEIAAMMKQVAFEHKCNVEELKYTVNNAGVINIRRMTSQEMIDRETKRQATKLRNKILKSKGLN